MFFRNANKIGTIYNRTTTCLLAASFHVSFVIQATENPIEVIEVEQQKLHATGNYQKIDRQAILEIGQTAADVLKKINGIQIRSVAGLGNQTEVSVRGSTNKQVQVYIDGQLINDSQFGGFDLNQLPVEQIESIEVSKSQALGTGSTPIGGVIRINTFDPTKNQLRLTAGTGSFGYEQFSGLVSHNVAGHQVSANVSYTYSDNNYEYLVKSPYVENADPLAPSTPAIEKSRNNQFKKVSLYLNDSFVVGSHKIKASLQYGEQDKSIPNYQFNLATNQTSLSSVTKRLAVTDDWLISGNWFDSLEIESYYQTKDEVFHDKRKHADPTQPDIDRKYYYYDDNYAVNFTAQLNLSALLANLNATPYLKLNKQEFESHSYLTDEQRLCNGISACDVIANQNTFELGSRFEWKNDSATTAWHLLFNHQQQTNSNEIKQPVSDNTDHFSDKKLNHANFTFEVGLVNSSLTVFKQNLVVSGNFSQGTRMPTLFEQFGDRGLLTGNDDLLPEQAISASLSLAQRFSQFNWQSNFYRRQLENAIVVTYNSSGIGRYTNVSDATIIGFEGQFDWQISTKLTAMTSLHLMDSLTESDTDAYNHKKVPAIYHNQLQLGLSYQISEQFKARLDTVHNSDLYYNRTNFIEPNRPLNPKGEPASQKVTDLSIQWNKGNYSASLSVLNLFDKQYLDLANRPAQGRSFQIKFTIEDI
ncbi:TonB-dependent receptor plug domain-containing protein [Catenovulum agarivorans]|uniref:TonB-dependent receptor plug domain-containing protein n=1 Tax=Catenovulum agarivorans TaxID=1172192 RepID=UPI0002F5EE67|nr:TonB-dependent receptor plug domain-containing protein [Catenovulum agarivorans]